MEWEVEDSRVDFAPCCSFGSFQLWRGLDISRPPFVTWLQMYQPPYWNDWVITAICYIYFMDHSDEPDVPVWPRVPASSECYV
jgi:hypothetical protein